MFLSLKHKHTPVSHIIKSSENLSDDLTYSEFMWMLIWHIQRTETKRLSKHSTVEMALA